MREVENEEDEKGMRRVMLIYRYSSSSSSIYLYIYIYIAESHLRASIFLLSSKQERHLSNFSSRRTRCVRVCESACCFLVGCRLSIAGGVGFCVGGRGMGMREVGNENEEDEG